MKPMGAWSSHMAICSQLLAEVRMPYVLSAFAAATLSASWLARQSKELLVF